MALSQLISLRAAGYCLALCALAAFALNAFLSHRRLNHIKGPWLASWSRLWLVKCTLRRTLYSDLADACKQYGTTLSLVSDAVSTADIQRLKALLLESRQTTL